LGQDKLAYRISVSKVI